MINTFSANSLKVINGSYEEFKNKYIDNLEIMPYSEELKKGNLLHGLICYYLKGYNTEKFESSLDKDDYILWLDIKNSDIIKLIKSGNEKYIEYPFFIKESLNNKPYFLTGRFDAVINTGHNYVIADWKTKNLPKDPKDDIQTVVYMHSLSRLFNTKNIEMVYYSLESKKYAKTSYQGGYLDKINQIVSNVI